MTKEDKSCACPPTPEVTDPGPVLFGIGCQMATVTTTAMASISAPQAIRAENMMLWDVIKQVGIALEEDYAQKKLMDLEKEMLRKKVLEKG